MKKYRIVLALECEYEVEADGFESALAQADDWFNECIPDIVEWEEISDSND